MRKKLVEYNRNNILEAARELFLKNGIVKTTVDDIAKEADCSKATIYVYFKSKEDIYYHIVFEYMEILKKGIIEAFSTMSFEEGYYSLCHKLVQFENDYPMYFECILGNIKCSKEDMEKLPILLDIFNCGEDTNTAVCEFLNNAQKQHYIRESIDLLQTTFVMWSSICGLISFWSNKEEYLLNRLSTSKSTFLDEGFKMILNSIRSETK